MFVSSAIFQKSRQFFIISSLEQLFSPRKGGSPKVRKEAGLPDLDEVMPDREIKSPRLNARFTRHAEEDVANKFVEAVNKLSLDSEEVSGILR